MKIGVIIQARTGSTRLPNKVLLPFYEKETILDIIVKKLKELQLPIVLATSTSTSDNILREFAEKHGVYFFQGDEHNVLKRFVDAAVEFDFDVIIRVCADNPFLSIEFAKQLVESYKRNPVEYSSFFTSQHIPVIKTHYGVFVEIVKLTALQKVLDLTTEKLYLEHVTNFIYAHPNLFSISSLPMPFPECDHIRLTIDTLDDFNFVNDIYRQYKNTSVSNLIASLTSNNEALDKMRAQILFNTK
jgi:spore coat polysaccharide biosynthesis protein SpsF (cytidylyltransferase family)